MEWNQGFEMLREYLDNNAQEYPSKLGNEDLYNWISQQRFLKKTGRLSNFRINQLNEINFAWNIVEAKWEKLFAQFRAYAMEHEFPPCKGFDDPELVKWYSYQSTCIQNDKVLSAEQRRRFLEIDDRFMGPGYQKKWVVSYQQLLDFKTNHPDGWPQYDRNNKESVESKLYIFCQTMRTRYREQSLSTYWIEKLEAIQFNFEGKTDNWIQHFEEIKALLDKTDSVSIGVIGDNAYSWITRHKKAYEEGTLQPYQAEKIETLQLDRYFESWEEKYEAVLQWVQEHGKIPTRTSHKDYHSWLGSQRSRYQNQRLSQDQVKLLQDLGYDLEAQGNERNEHKWFKRLNQYRSFLVLHDREPSYFGDRKEKKLYLWAAAQRAVKAGNALNRKPLSPQREQALEAIGFKWVGDGRKGENTWEENLEELARYVQPSGEVLLPSTLNGERNILYTWWHHQKRAFYNRELPYERILAFREIGIDLNNPIHQSNRDGFTKWANSMRQLSEFVVTNGHYPKSGTDKAQSNLYQTWARSRRAFQKQELNERQLALIAELQIELN